MKHFVLIFLCISLLLLAGCGYSEEELAAAIDLAHSEGYDAGKTAGIEEGYSNGYADGEVDGYAEGKSDGYSEGYDYGRDVGYDDGYYDRYNEGYDGRGSGKGLLDYFYESESNSGLTNWNATVYVSNSGIIHDHSSCSGMKYYTRMSYSDAIAAGYTKCSKCY